MTENVSRTKYKDKFIAFIDILGFKKKVEASENGTGLSLDELLELQLLLGNPDTRNKFVKSGPIVCPCSKYIDRDLDFYLTQISDCVIMSCEISPAGIINLINECSASVLRLMMKGTMCRGYILRGAIYHTENQIIGSGYQNAYSKEENGIIAFQRTNDEKGTPFVEIDPAVCDYIENCGDKLVQTMFDRHVKSDGKVKALFPFARLTPTVAIGGFGGQAFDAQKEKQNIISIRLDIEKTIKSVMDSIDKTNTSAVEKSEHYFKALQEQLFGCDHMVKVIDGLNSYSLRKISDIS